MSIHPSLSAADKSKKQRSVLKRIERLKLMSEKNEWSEKDDVYGLPKIKTVRIKIKKEKAEKTEAVAGTEGAATATPATKEQAGAKGKEQTGAKGSEKGK
ncbi:MAG: small basic protein [Candidatus Omnitrophota bacterium]|jgi:small basic protein (TIGR04137 family)|nr:MAG: small basic protein [Candidatus Omnitrophota bacterium]